MSPAWGQRPRQAGIRPANEALGESWGNPGGILGESWGNPGESWGNAGTGTDLVLERIKKAAGFQRISRISQFFGDFWRFSGNFQ